MLVTILVALFSPVMIIMLYVLVTDSGLLLAFVIPVASYSKWLRLIIGLPNIFVILYGWATVLLTICVYVPYVFISIFLTSEIK